MAAGEMTRHRPRIVVARFAVHVLRYAASRGQYAAAPSAAGRSLVESSVPLNGRFGNTLAHLHGGRRRGDRH
jgi:hypothetical protein